MNEQVLNITQMQHLRELGVDTSRASAMIYEISETETYCGYKNQVVLIEGYLDSYLSKEPGFTLQDVLDLLPKGIVVPEDTYDFNMWYDNRNDEWSVGYVLCSDLFENVCFSNKNLIDAAYEMLCWCIENEFIEQCPNNLYDDLM